MPAQTNGSDACREHWTPRSGQVMNLPVAIIKTDSTTVRSGNSMQSCATYLVVSCNQNTVETATKVQSKSLRHKSIAVLGMALKPLCLTPVWAKICNNQKQCCHDSKKDHSCQNPCLSCLEWIRQNHLTEAYTYYTVCIIDYTVCTIHWDRFMWPQYEIERCLYLGGCCYVYGANSNSLGTVRVCPHYRGGHYQEVPTKGGSIEVRQGGPQLIYTTQGKYAAEVVYRGYGLTYSTMCVYCTTSAQPFCMRWLKSSDMLQFFCSKLIPHISDIIIYIICMLCVRGGMCVVISFLYTISSCSVYK